MQDTNEQTPSQTIEIADLTVETEAVNEVKGGQNSSAVVSLGKLGRVENQADPKLGTTLNHNETTISDEAEESAPEALADLSVCEEQAEQTKGGLPAIQKVREAAGRMQS